MQICKAKITKSQQFEITQIHSISNRLLFKYSKHNHIMGATKSSLVKAYNEEYLHYYIERSDFKNIELLLQKRPELIDSTLTHKTKMTPLYKAAYNGNLKLVELLVQKYNANVNHVTEIGQTALMAATKRNSIEVVRYLLSRGADSNAVSRIGLSTLQYAILPGFYEIALVLYQAIQNKQLGSPEKYEELAQQYTYRYVCYHVFLKYLEQGIDPQNVSDFLTKPKIVLKDPVADPRETWKAWMKRQMEFKDPPLVERDELPAQLQPQNRKYGKINHFFSNLARSPMVQKSHFNPPTQSTISAPHTQHELKKTNPQIGDQVEVNTVS